uniref:(northern house mosquito) hypothetical protein n=1 Tax=Culex pipiens TaxID=7175 RepID=A0A8D8BHC7_CULPI
MVSTGFVSRCRVCYCWRCQGVAALILPVCERSATVSVHRRGIEAGAERQQTFLTFTVVFEFVALFKLVACFALLRSDLLFLRFLNHLHSRMVPGHRILFYTLRRRLLVDFSDGSTIFVQGFWCPGFRRSDALLR